jgi:hypothetical protein
MNDSGEKLAFIVGHYKSGSTWLVNMLSLHPDIRGVSETHVVRYSEKGADLQEGTEQLFKHVAWADGGFRRLLRHRAGLWTLAARRALGLATGQTALRAEERPTTMLDLSLSDLLRLRRRLRRLKDGDEYLRTFFAFLVDQLHPARYLVEKTPTNMPYVPRIRAVFPRSKLIAVYRDGRDVTVSDKYHLARAYGKTRPFADRVRRWREAIEAQFRYADEYHILAISYEALLDRPTEVVSSVLAHLEIEPDAARIEDMIRRSSFEFVTGRSRGAENGSSFYRKGVAGDWRNYYTDEERRIFSELAGDTLVRLGYESDPDWRSWR